MTRAYLCGFVLNVLTLASCRNMPALPPDVSFAIGEAKWSWSGTWKGSGGSVFNIAQSGNTFTASGMASCFATLNGNRAAGYCSQPSRALEFVMSDDGRYAKGTVTMLGIPIDDVLTRLSEPVRTLNTASAPAEKNPSLAKPPAVPATGFQSVPSATTVRPEATDVAAAALTGEARTALVVGNGDYERVPLRTPRNDARAIANVLERLGFNVRLLENTKRRDLLAAIEKFGEQLRDRHGVGLVFYAGHGMQVKGRNYLIPVDAQVQSEMTAVAETVDADWLLETMSASNTRINIVILDACRDNPYEQSVRGSGRGLAPMTATDARGTLIAYSTDPGKTALDGTGFHSPYADALLSSVEQPGLSIEQVFKQVRIKVMNATAGQQTPWETSSLTGEFQFK